MDKRKAHALLAELSSYGVPPRDIVNAGEVIPMFSVGLDDWINRLALFYLQDLSRSNAEFKLVIAPYGGGKTHFLMASAVRALSERFAVSFVQCVPDKSGGSARVDNPLGLYAEAIGSIKLPGQEGQGVPALLDAVVRAKRNAIEASGVQDPDAAFNLSMNDLKRRYKLQNAMYGEYARIASIALEGYWHEEGPGIAASAAEKWLSGRFDLLTKDEWAAIGKKPPPRREEGAEGRNLILFLAKFTSEANCHGLCLLIDEVETLFTAKGKALQAVLGAMRVMIDWSGSEKSGVGVPLFCVFAATPDILDPMTKYPALQQRLAVVGGTFDEGTDTSPQISLDRISIGHGPMLRAIGERLVEVAIMAFDGKLTKKVQIENANRLSTIAGQMTLDIAARRLFIKTWASLLILQSNTGERVFDEAELRKRYSGDFEGLKAAEKATFEP